MKVKRYDATLIALVLRLFVLPTEGESLPMEKRSKWRETKHYPQINDPRSYPVPKESQRNLDKKYLNYNNLHIIFFYTENLSIGKIKRPSISIIVQLAV